MKNQIVTPNPTVIQESCLGKLSRKVVQERHDGCRAGSSGGHLRARQAQGQPQPEGQ